MNPATWTTATAVPFSFDAPLEWRLKGTPDMVKQLLLRVASELEFEGWGFHIEDKRLGLGVPTLIVSISGRVGLEQIGQLQVEELPGEKTRLRVPYGRGDTGPKAWPADPFGRLFSAFVVGALAELRNSGFLAASSRFNSFAAVETADRELGSAEDATAFAAIGNMCRSAMIALANELYAAHMLPKGEVEPKGDDADRKLVLVVSHYFAGKSERYQRSLKKHIEGCWGVAAALSHRKNATREEAEACVALVAALFEVVSFIVPR